MTENKEFGVKISCPVSSNQVKRQSLTARGAPGGFTWQDYQMGISKRNWESRSPWPHRTECLRELEQEKSLGSRQAGPSFLRGSKVFPWRSLQLLLPPSCPQCPASTLRYQAPFEKSENKGKHQGKNGSSALSKPQGSLECYGVQRIIQNKQPAEQTGKKTDNLDNESVQKLT